MFPMKIGGILVTFCHSQNLSFTEKISDKANARWRAGFGKAVRQHDAGMASEIAREQSSARKRRSNKQIDFVEDFRHVLDEQVANSLRLKIFDGGNESFSPERIRPGVSFLLRQPVVMA